MAAVSNARLAAEGVGNGLGGGAIAHLGWSAAVANGVPALVALPGGDVMALAWWHFALTGVAAGLGAALVALLVDGRRRSRTLFLTVATAVLAASALLLTSQPPEVARATRVVLAAGHAVVFAAVVPALARRLRRR